MVGSRFGGGAASSSAGHDPQFQGRRRQKEARSLIEKSAILGELPDRAAEMINIDDTDRELIALLRDDARTPVAALAQRLKVARGTVQNRLARLQREGVIVGYTLRLKPQVEAHRIRALMTIAVEGNRGPDVLRSLRGDPAVTSLHTTNGRWDIVAEIQAETLEAFDRVLGAIRLVDGIANTETSILLSTHKL
jgi:DNA-binding Lrp family transcriptional regulator